MKQLGQTPSISMQYEHKTLPGVTTVKVTADSRAVTVAYLNLLGNALDVREFSVQENDELRDIVQITYFDDVWNIDLVLALVDIVEPDIVPAITFTAPALVALAEAHNG